jgi:hypothetical protein
MKEGEKRKEKKAKSPVTGDRETRVALFPLSSKKQRGGGPVSRHLVYF